MHKRNTVKAIVVKGHMKSIPISDHTYNIMGQSETDILRQTKIGHLKACLKCSKRKQRNRFHQARTGHC